MKILHMKSVKRFYVIYFNGFCLKGEEALFADYLHVGDTTVVGFSYGAQKAFEYVYNRKERVDRLILLSPAFFQTEKRSFVRTQLRYFEAENDTYIKQFLNNVIIPSSINLEKYLSMGTKEELEALLTYIWDKSKIEEVSSRGTKIEVFIGDEDKIINASEALAFFKDNTTLYILKNSGHILEQSL